MAKTIQSLPSADASQLKNNHLVIVEEVPNNSGPNETQKTTLQDIYNWLNDNHTFNIKTEQINNDSANIDKTIVNNTVSLKFGIPEWMAKEYKSGDLVYYNQVLYLCLSDNNDEELNEINWLRIGYKIGKHLTLDDDNTLNGEGISNWIAGSAYNINDFVIYEKKLYQCINTNSDTVWNKDNWQNIGEGNGIIIYENRKTYLKDDIVIYNNKLYKRINTGTDLQWVENNWIRISSGDFTKVFIKYSNKIPSSDADLIDTPSDYMGIYYGNTDTAPTTYSLYQWYKIKGEDGFVNVEANTIVVDIILLASDWEGEGPYTQSISNNIFINTMYPIIDLSYSNDSSNWADELKAYSYITRAVCNDSSITFYCIEEKPSIDVAIKVRINGDVNSDNFLTIGDFTTYTQQVATQQQQINTLISQNNQLVERINVIEDTLSDYDMLSSKSWLDYGGVTNEYNTLTEILNSSDYEVLLNTQASAAYAAYVSETIADAIKNNIIYLRKALTCSYKDMFIESEFDYLENISNYIDENPKVTANNYAGIVEFSADRCSDQSKYDYTVEDKGYYGYMAFDGSIDSMDLKVMYSNRHIWSALGTNRWVQYNYSIEKYLYGIDIYAIRDNAPAQVIISGSNDNINFTTIKTTECIMGIGVNQHQFIFCGSAVAYKYYRFTITDNIISGSCCAGDIRIYTFKE